ncbi:unnamed protein product, partial [Prunus brigantina]
MYEEDRPKFIPKRGHEDAVTSVSVEASGQWIASGVDAILNSLLHSVTGQDVLLLNTGCGNEEVQKRTKELLSVEMPVMTPVSKTASSVSWLQDDKLEGISLRHSKSKTVASVEWHRKLSKKLTQTLSFKLQGIAVTSVFHLTRSFFFISTKKIIRVYDMVKEGKLIRKLEIRLREVSSIAVHPSVVRELYSDLSGLLHQKDINNVCFHRSYPLFATCSDDCTAYVFHGMIYSDLNQNPLIVPLEILRGHSSTNGRGVMDCKFHPRQPWLFTAGADSVVRLFAIKRKRKETACTGSYCKLWISLVGIQPIIFCYEDPMEEAAHKTTFWFQVTFLKNPI